jgi:hypothetical protein
MNNKIQIHGGYIIVQSCDEETANIGIFLRSRMTYYHVELPSLKLEDRKVYYNEEVKQAEFDAILQANKSRLLETIRHLNQPKEQSRLQIRMEL